VLEIGVRGQPNGVVIGVIGYAVDTSGSMLKKTLIYDGYDI